MDGKDPRYAPAMGKLDLTALHDSDVDHLYAHLCASLLDMPLMSDRATFTPIRTRGKRLGGAHPLRREGMEERILRHEDGRCEIDVVV